MSFNRARSALLTYYQAGQGKLPVASFEKLVQHYRTHRYPDGGILIHNDFLEEFEGALKVPNAVDATTAMKNLAKVTPPGTLPNTQAFFKALADQAGKLTAKEFTTAVGEGLTKTAKTIATGIGAGVGLYAAIALGAILLPKLIDEMPKILQKLSKVKP